MVLLRMFCDRWLTFVLLVQQGGNKTSALAILYALVKECSDSDVRYADSFDLLLVWS